VDQLRIELDGGRSWAPPGGEVAGRIVWALDEPAERVEVRLLWYTEGRGSRDVGVMSRRVIQEAGAQGEDSFRFTVPAGPYSFEGRLITLRWAVEAQVEPSGPVAQEILVVAPTPVPVRLCRDGAGRKSKAS